MSVDANLATLHAHAGHDCDGCEEAIRGVEAELSRLREERDAAKRELRDFEHVEGEPLYETAAVAASSFNFAKHRARAAEAEATRLREERDELRRALTDELDNWNPERRPTITAEKEAAEARCVRLQQALIEHRALIVIDEDGAAEAIDMEKWAPVWLRGSEALAGLDTPTHRKQNVEYWRARSRVAVEERARLQQALRELREDMKTGVPVKGWTVSHAPLGEAEIGRRIDEILAGLDTPADICPECGSGLITLHVAAYPCSRRNTPADSRRCQCPVGSYDRGNAVHADYCPLADSQPEEPT